MSFVEQGRSRLVHARHYTSGDGIPLVEHLQAAKSPIRMKGPGSLDKLTAVREVIFPEM